MVSQLKNGRALSQMRSVSQGLIFWIGSEDPELHRRPHLVRVVLEGRYREVA